MGRAGGSPRKTIALLGSIALVALSPAASADAGAGLSTDDGAVALAAGGHYVVYDGPLHGGHVYSFGLGSEQNGVPGYQRRDDVGDETNAGEVEQDCFISCTF